MDAIPWYKSPVYIGAVVTILSTLGSLSPKLAGLLGISTAADTATLVNNAFGIIALVAGVFTAIKRQTSIIQPLTLTAASAAAHPQTIANQQATPTDKGTS